MKHLRVLLVLLLSIVSFIVSFFIHGELFQIIVMVLSALLSLAAILAFAVEYHFNKSINEALDFIEDLSDDDKGRLIACKDGDKLSTDKLSITINNREHGLYNCLDCIFYRLECYEVKVKDKYLLDICLDKNSVFVEN